MSKKQKKTLVRILIACALFFLLPTLASSFVPTLRPLAYFIVFLIIGGDVLLRAIRNITHGQIFDENFLMAIASIGAFLIGECAEAVAVLLFYQVGELFQSYAVGKSRKSIAALMDIRPDYANIEVDGALEQVDPDDVAVGDIIVVKAGERIALDGEIVTGNSTLDTAALTGESMPRDVAVGDTVMSGCINQTGVLRIRVSRIFCESTVSRILDLVENASEKKAKAENFITKFARYYTPGVVILATLLVLIPSALLLFVPSTTLPAFLANSVWTDWLNRALIFLVISCPCALVISVPLSFFGGIGGASKHGILIKGASYLEALAQTEIVVFDKTGTLTKGTFQVTGCYPATPDISPDLLLEYAALAESYSDHPISLSLKQAYGKTIDATRVADVQEVAGQGVCAMIDGQKVLVGNAKLLQSISLSVPDSAVIGTAVHVALAQQYIGYLVIADEVKDDAACAIARLKTVGVRKTVMLTGDTDAVAASVSKQLGLDAYRAQLLPGDKVDAVESLLAETSPKGTLVFVGDGINDAPVLSRADVGIAMGGLGSDAAIEAADVVLMQDEPSKISTAIRLSRKTLRIVKQNIVFALGIKALVLLLGTFGAANMWEAVFADVGVSIIAIINASRALHITKE